MSRREIPQYYVYGEPVRSLDGGFMHVELVSTRGNRHQGEVAAHTHPQLAQITFWTKGSGTYHIEEQSWTFSAPAISFVPSGVVHGFSVRPGSDAIVVSIADDCLAEILHFNGQNTLGALFTERLAGKGRWHRVASLMRMLHDEYRASPDLQRGILSPLAGAVIGLITQQQDKADRRTGEALPLAQKLQHMVDKGFREKRAIETYVEELHVTRHLLDKAAKAAFGLPVKQLILQRRLLEAKRLLKFTIRSSEDIAAELGFSDPAYFSREFKKHTGLAPGMWRTQRR